MPYDRFVRSIVAASGTPETTPTVMWYRRLRTPDAFVDDTAQVFLGMRLQCAKCHHHPFEKWGQDDYYGFAAFFARVGRKPTLLAQGGNRDEEAIFSTRSGTRLASQDRAGDESQRAGRRSCSRSEQFRSTRQARRLDGRPQEPLFRQGAGQSLLGSFLRQRNRRAARRHAVDQPAFEPRALGRASPKTLSRADMTSSTLSVRFAQAAFIRSRACLILITKRTSKASPGTIPSGCPLRFCSTRFPW